MLVAIFIIVNLVSGFLINDQLKKIVSSRINNEAEIIISNMGLSIEALMHHEDFEEDLKLVLNAANEYVLIEKAIYCDGNQQIIASSDGEGIGGFSDNQCIHAVANDDKSIAKYFNIDEHIYEMAIPVIGQDQRGVIYLELSQYYIESLLSNSTFMLLMLILGIQVVVMVLIYIMLNFYVLRPLNVFQTATVNLAENDYSSRVTLDRRDEYGNLASTFNTMLDTIEETFNELRSQKEIAEKSSEARMAFLARMSHEIRTPLNSIVGFSGLLLEKAKNEDKKELSIIVSAADHLLNIVNDILDISKFESHQMTLKASPVNVKALFEDLYEMFYMQFKSKGVQLIVETPDLSKYLLCDEFRLREIIINLIGNAYKFTSEGYVKVTSSYDGETLLVRVEDTGMGIAANKQALIFEPFEQVENDQSRLVSGTGLGLAISRRIALLMGGDIHVFSDGHSGSTFVLSLVAKETEKTEELFDTWLHADPDIEDIIIDFIPSLGERIDKLQTYITQGDIDSLKTELHALKGLTGNLHMKELFVVFRDFENYLHAVGHLDQMVSLYMKSVNQLYDAIPQTYKMSQKVTTSKRLLLAEDVFENRQLVMMLLKDQKLEIDEAENGQVVIDKLQEASYDVLLLDIQMPLVSGLDVLEWLKSHESYKPRHVIALTANARRSDIDLYLEMGCTDYLSKPIDKKILRQVISSL